MANWTENTLRVVGLKQSVKEFADVLSKETFGQLHGKPGIYQWEIDEHKPSETILDVHVDRLYTEMKWEVPVKKLKEASTKFPELLFSLDSWLEHDGPSGQFIVKDGKILDEDSGNAGMYLFDGIVYPHIDRLPYYLPVSLEQLGYLKLQEAIKAAKALNTILTSKEFSPLKYPEHITTEESRKVYRDTMMSKANLYRDRAKTEKARQIISDLLNHLDKATQELDLKDVFLPNRPGEWNCPGVSEEYSAAA